MLVSLQSYTFSSRKFDYVFRYLEAEQIGAIVREEKQAAWKKAQLQSIRESEGKKCQRNLQVEEMKSEMLNLQIQLHGNSATTVSDISRSSEGLARRGSTSLYLNRDAGKRNCTKLLTLKSTSPLAVESRKHSAESPLCEITELEEDAIYFLGNQAVTNLASFLNIGREDPDTIEHSSEEDELHNGEEIRDTRHASLDRSSSLQSDKSRTMSDAASPQMGRVFHHIWSQCGPIMMCVQHDIKTAGGKLTLFQTSLCEKISWDNLNTVDNLDPQCYLDTYDKNDIELICCQPDASTFWIVPDVKLRKFSMVLRVTGSGDVRTFDMESHVPTALVLIAGKHDLHRGSPEWWSFHDINLLNISGCGGLMGPMAIFVSEETPQGLLGETLSKFSIWGLYITFVLAVGRFISLQCSDLRMRIPFDYLPCDRLIVICEDIYAARAEGELGVEEFLYWTLIEIYRSPTHVARVYKT
ncbi:hypothetical protein Acr_13g0001690 [Actinidia rufa]|uniref:Piezo non-specific cation channel cap domain-containing protein n=1 Tax=Actinidia rufa TaxID=165716 RepID=A0A7J0FJ91_9ERIC|nr:hypothetical protein Acr_13g0001690 [Actinidia rufa]